MYNYTEFDDAFIKARNSQFRNQVKRRIDGNLTEDEFKPLRLMNGLYLQLHAYMLRVAIPYGTLNSSQMEKLAIIADRWDKGYGHFTTRQNIEPRRVLPYGRCDVVNYCFGKNNAKALPHDASETLRGWLFRIVP